MEKIYATYKYIFQQSKAAAGLLPDTEENTAQTPLDQAQTVLDGLFCVGGPCALSLEWKKRGDTQLLPNTVLCKHGDVTVLNVNDYKVLNYQEGHENYQLETHPGCFVVVDNRPGVAQILIERSPACGFKPDCMAALLQDAINLKLAPYRLEVEIRNKLRNTSFWELVNRQTRDYKDSVQSVTFHLLTPDEVAGIDADSDSMQQLRHMIAFTRQLNGCKSALSVTGNKHAPLMLDEGVENVANLVRLCTNNSFYIDVRFKHYGLYHYGKKSREKIYIQMNNDAVEAFCRGDADRTLFPDLYNDLMNKLELARQITGDYEEHPVKKRRKKSRA